jgi:peptidoglycan hydrolase-like protein with peptidoglycan-binding domain
MSHNHNNIIAKIALTGAVATMSLIALPGIASASTQASSGVASSAAKTAPGHAKFGEKGAHVKAMQEAIIRNGFTLTGGATGVFDSRTLRALRNFQKVVGLKVTGAVDAPTAKVLKISTAAATAPVDVAVAPANTSYPFTMKTLPRRGTGGDNVIVVQKALAKTGLTVRGGLDGIFGKGVVNTIRNFQKVAGFTVTGTLNERTAIALGLVAPKVAPAPVQVAAVNTPAVATPAPVETAPAVSAGRISGSKLPSRGDRSDNVRVIQNALITAGITVNGGADGIFGGGTAVAIKDFQERNGLNATGVLDYATAIKMGVTSAPSIQLDAFPVQGPCSFTNTWHASRGNRLHLGVDIIAAEGNLLYAVADGVISKVYTVNSDKLSGNGIRLTKADGTYFFYGHMQRLADGITVGAVVKAGQVVGYNGKTGNTSTPHLHFEIHPFGGEAIDPTSAVAAVDACKVTAPRS